MTLIGQTTVSTTATFHGIGLHSGVEAILSVRPAGENTGIVFLRRDEQNGIVARISADITRVADTRLGTILQDDNGVSIATVEHVMAALAICDIDNAIIDLDGPEPPIADGSALPFVDMLERAGKARQTEARQYRRISKTIEVRDGDRFIRAEPADRPILDVSIDFEDAVIGKQRVMLDLTDELAVRKRLAPSRTFCRLRDIEGMRAAGYSRGGSLDNAIVVDGGRILNQAGIRDQQEFVLHKALDLLGDLRLIGGPFIGRITASKCGHDLNTAFARALTDTPGALERFVVEEKQAAALRASA